MIPIGEWLAYAFIAAVVLGTLATLLRRPPPAGTTDADVVEQLRKGNWIRALYWYRSIHRVGVKAAKKELEKLAENLRR